MKEIIDRFVRGAACVLPTEQFCSTSFDVKGAVFVRRQVRKIIPKQENASPVSDPRTIRNK